MSAARPAEILRQLEQCGAPDADLLARFVATKDAAAFAELVRRHGALVLGVCRRVTGHAEDAEDAFQATFLVLAMKAGSLRNAGLLGNWLYGVAFRVAWRAKRSARRRRAREVTVATLPEPHAPPVPAASEVQPILDAELAALPQCYREAIVLCDLQGASREEAAAALGIPEGTLSSRLANGRKKLAARLTRRGVALPAAALPIVLSEAQAQAVPNELVTKTCVLVANWAADGAVPGPLARLAEGGIPVRKLMLLGAAVLVGVAGAVFAARPADDAPPVDPPKPLAVAPKPAADAPEPKEERQPKDAPDAPAPRLRRAFDSGLTGNPIMMWNPTGTHLALQGAEPVAAEGTKTRVMVRIFPLNDPNKDLWFRLGDTGRLVGVAPDGQTANTEVREYHLISGKHQLKTWGVHGQLAGRSDQLAVTRSTDLDLPEAAFHAFASDGKTFRAVGWHRDGNGKVVRLELFEADTATGRMTKSLLKLGAAGIAQPWLFSANGTRFVALDPDYSKATVYDVTAGKELREITFKVGKLIERHAIGSHMRGGPALGLGPRSELQPDPTAALSPDGKWLVVARGIGETLACDTDTGVSVSLDGANELRLAPGGAAFSGDGRLLAAPVTAYTAKKLALAKGEMPYWEPGGQRVVVWDTKTGKQLKSWRGRAEVAFNPVRPLLAMLEDNGDRGARVGFWDFAAEVEKK